MASKTITYKVRVDDKEIKKLKKDISSTGGEVKVRVDDTEIKKLKKDISSAGGNVKVNVDTSKAQEQLNQLSKVKVNVDTSKATDQLKQISKVKVNVDTSKAKDQLKQVGKGGVNVKMKVDTTEAQDKVKQVGKSGVKVKMKVDSSQIKGISSKLKESSTYSKQIEKSFEGVANYIGISDFGKLTNGFKAIVNYGSQMVANGRAWVESIKGATAAETVLNGVRSVGLGIMSAINVMTGGLLIVLGAIVTAVAGVASYLTRTEEGAYKLKKAMNAVGLIFDRILDATIGYAKLLYNIATGDLEGIKQSWNDILETITGTSDALTEQNKLSDEAAQLEKDKRDWVVKRAQIEKEIADLREKSKDKDRYTEKERLDFLNKASKLTKQIGDKDVEFAKRKLSIIKRTNALSSSTTADKNKEAQAEAEVSKSKERALSKQRMLTSEISGLNKQITGEITKQVDLEHKKAIKSVEVINSLKRSLGGGGKIEKDDSYEVKRAKIKANYKYDLQEAEELLNKHLISYSQYELKILSFEQDRYKQLKELEEEHQKDVEEAASKEEQAIERLWKARIKGKELGGEYDMNSESGIDQHLQDLEDQLDAEMMMKLANTELTQTESMAIEQEYANQKLELENQAQEAKQSLRDKELQKERELADKKIEEEERVRDAKIQLGQAGADAVDDILSMAIGNQNEKNKKGFESAKKLRIAQASMAAASAIAVLWATPTTIPEPFGSAAKVAQSVGIAANMVAQIHKIKSTQFGGGGSVGSSGGTKSSPTPQISNISPVTSGRSLLEMEKANKPQQAFVVQSQLQGENEEYMKAKAASVF